MISRLQLSVRICGSGAQTTFAGLLTSLARLPVDRAIVGIKVGLRLVTGDRFAGCLACDRVESFDNMKIVSLRFWRGIAVFVALAVGAVIRSVRPSVASRSPKVVWLFGGRWWPARVDRSLPAQSLNWVCLAPKLVGSLFVAKLKLKLMPDLMMG